MIADMCTYGHRTGMCIYSHKLRATEISVTAHNMRCSSDCCLYIPSVTPHEQTCVCQCARCMDSWIHFCRPLSSSIRRAPQFHWPPNSRRSASSPDAPANLRATMSSRTAQPMPHAALRRRRRRPPTNKGLLSQYKNEHLLTVCHRRPSSQGVSAWLHGTEPEGSPSAASSS